MDVADLVSRSDVPGSIPGVVPSSAKGSVSGNETADADGQFSRQLAALFSAVPPTPAIDSATTATAADIADVVALVSLLLNIEAQTVTTEAGGKAPPSDQSDSAPTQATQTIPLDAIVVVDPAAGEIPTTPIELPAVQLDEEADAPENSPTAGIAPGWLAALAAGFTPAKSQPQNSLKGVNAQGDASAAIHEVANSPASPPVELVRFLTGAKIEVDHTPKAKLPVPEEPVIETSSDVDAKVIPTPAESALPSVSLLPPPQLQTPRTETPVEATEAQPVAPVAVTQVESAPRKLEVPPDGRETTVTKTEQSPTVSEKVATFNGGEAPVATVQVSSPAATPSTGTANGSPGNLVQSSDGPPIDRTNSDTTAKSPTAPPVPATQPRDLQAVGSTTPAISPHDPHQFAERLGQFVLRSFDQGEQLSVRITPPDLGTIVIDVHSGAQGLQVRFETASASAQQLITERLPQLHEALAQLGRPADRVDVIRTESGFGAGVSTDAGTGRGFEQAYSERREPVVQRTPESTPQNTERESGTSIFTGTGRMQELNIQI